MGSDLSRRVVSVLKKSRSLRLINTARKGITHRELRDELARNGMDIVQMATGALTRAGFTCVPWSGTLLGFVREGGIIKHDLDIDIGVVVDDGFAWEDVERALVDAGCAKDREFSCSKGVTEQKYRWGQVVFDVFGIFPIGESEGECFFYEKWPDVAYATEDDFSVRVFALPLPRDVSTEDIGGFAIPMPANAPSILERQYGVNWRVPDPSWVSASNWVPTDDAGHRRIFIKQ